MIGFSKLQAMHHNLIVFFHGLDEVYNVTLRYYIPYLDL
jgi:hypothetical protein